MEVAESCKAKIIVRRTTPWEATQHSGCTFPGRYPWLSSPTPDAIMQSESPLHPRWLGRVGYAAALALQEELVAHKREDHSLGDELLLLEHEPVYTIGRTPDQSSLRDGAQLPHPLFTTNRGGQATYHGPGQLVGYPIIDLRGGAQDLHRYLRWLEDVLLELLSIYEITALTRPA